MSFLSWNYRGLANPRTTRLLFDIIQQYRPSLIFLSETLVKSDKVKKVTKQLGFSGCFAIDVFMDVLQLMFKVMQEGLL